MEKKYPVFGNKAATAFIIILAAVVLLFIFKEEKAKKPGKVSGDLFKIGKIEINRKNNENKFEAVVRKSKGKVFFLICLEGYKWLSGESAVISDARLEDLQTAISFLNWRLWDEIWTKNTDVNKQMSISVICGSSEKNASEFIKNEKKADIRNILFFGSCYFDPIVLKESANIKCESCSFYDLEKKSINLQFKKNRKNPDYEIDEKVMPKEGTKAVIKIRVAESKEAQ